MINEGLFKKALTQHGQGEYDKAGENYDRLLKMAPNHPHLLHAKGLLCMHRNADQEALKYFNKALDANDRIAIVHQSMARLFEKMQDSKKAANSYSLYAFTLLASGSYEEALENCKKSLELDPTNQKAQYVKISTMAQKGKTSQEMDRAEKITKTVKKNTKNIKELYAIAESYHKLEKRELALRTYLRCLEIEPDSAYAHYMAGLYMLLFGNFKEGLEHFEYRMKYKYYAEAERSELKQPMLERQTPSELNGKLLVISEQSFGDIIQFSRYVKMLAAEGYDIIFEVSHRIIDLFKEGFEDKHIKVIPRNYFYMDKWHLGWFERLLGRKPQRPSNKQIYRNLDFAAWVGTLSLPRFFGTTPETMPGDTPYISIKPAKVARWKKRIPYDSSKPSIGLVWSGDPKHIDDYKRSAPAELLLPLVERGDAKFYSLQKGERAAYEFPAGTVTNLDPLLTDFTQTGAAMMCLDLIITVDTAPAHLAGALNRPVWIMLPKVKDWRWLTEGETTGWYPSARLFRHPAPMDWVGTIANVNAALDLWIAEWLAGQKA